MQSRSHGGFPYKFLYSSWSRWLNCLKIANIYRKINSKNFRERWRIFTIMTIIKSRWKVPNGSRNAIIRLVLASSGSTIHFKCIPFLISYFKVRLSELPAHARVAAQRRITILARKTLYKIFSGTVLRVRQILRRRRNTNHLNIFSEIESAKTLFTSPTATQEWRFSS